MATDPTPHLEADLPAINFYGWTLRLSPDGAGLVVEVPEGKELDLGDERFRVRSDKKRLEVRAK